MRTLPALLFCAALAVAADVGPELRSWVLAASTNPAIQAIAPDVHAVHSDNDFVYVESAGLSLHSFGSLEANQYDPPLGPRVLSFRIPRHPVAAQGEHMSTPLGIIGAFVTGMRSTTRSARFPIAIRISGIRMPSRLLRREHLTLLPRSVPTQAAILRS